MKRISLVLIVCIVTGVGLISAAVVSAQCPAEKPPEGAFAAFGMTDVTQGMTELVAASEAGDALLAYSAFTGRWHKQPIPPGHDKVPYTVGGGMVCVRLGKVLYGFSSEKGAWDSIEVGDDVAGSPSVGF